jgi:hypothetical protein
VPVRDDQRGDGHGCHEQCRPAFGHAIGTPLNPLSHVNLFVSIRGFYALRWRLSIAKEARAHRPDWTDMAYTRGRQES